MGTNRHIQYAAGKTAGRLEIFHDQILVYRYGITVQEGLKGIAGTDWASSNHGRLHQDVSFTV